MAYLDDYDRIPEDHPQERVALIGRVIRTDPHGLFSELRASRPIFRTPGFTLVTRFKDVQEILSRNEVFTVKLYAPRMDPVVNGLFMLARDNTAANWREKSIMKAMLRPEDLPMVRALAGRFAGESLDGCAKDGKIEVVSRLGREVPVRICGDYFGFPVPDMPTMYRWSKATQSDMFKNLANDPNIHAVSVQAGQEMRPYLIDLLAQKRAQADGSTRAEDVFSRLVRTEFPEELGFDDTRVVANMATGIPQVSRQPVENFEKATFHKNERPYSRGFRLFDH